MPSAVRTATTPSGAPAEVRGAAAWAKQAVAFGHLARLVRPALVNGAIGVVLASIVGIFWHNDAFQFVLSFIGVIVFTGLTAYDAQRLKEMALALPDGRVGSYAIVGALALYLDFINLFMFLLRFTGSRRD